MSREKSISIYTDHPCTASAKDPWRYSWPNDADQPFNYTRLLEVTADHGIARNTRPDARIAILGAGAAGLTAARELHRCGFRHIDVYEASDRIGGRLWSLPADGQDTTFELGAMRIPFFSEPGSHNSLIDHYARLFGLRTQPFPNPGSIHARTGIFLNDGLGPDPSGKRRPSMDLWEKESPEPPLEILVRVHQKWRNFAEFVQLHMRDAYNAGGDVWRDAWRGLVRRYWDMSFVDLVFAPAYAVYDPALPGDFGGLGMTREEASIFSVIGAGDGGWGAFFHVAALYPIRTLLFGYGTNHQLIQGRFDPESGAFLGGPCSDETPVDSNGWPLGTPGWKGVQSLAEGLFYLPASEGSAPGPSLYSATKGADPRVRLHCRTPATRLRRVNGKVEVETRLGTSCYDAVVLTCPTWALQLGVEMGGFDAEMLPFSARQGLSQSHWITSCKVFFPLRERYWEKSRIPQLIMTDSFIQGVYGYAVDTSPGSRDPGVLLASYTWEDDATKLMSTPTQEELAERCLRELDRILVRSENIGTPISPFVDRTRPVVIHWARQPTYAGCAKLYRARMWKENEALAAYNQEHSARSGLYFAGDGYSVTSGWVEAALRSAMDATIYIARNLGAEFDPAFDPDRDYPKIDTSWSPEEYAGSFRDIRRVTAGQVLCREGDASDNMFLLVRGEVCAVRAGREVDVMSETNTLTGYLSYFSGGKRTATLLARTDCEIIDVAADRVESMLRSAPGLALKLLRDVTRHWLQSQA